MTQGGHGFCLGMTSLPADDARKACFFIASNGCLRARSHHRNSLGRHPSRFVSSLECCLGARKYRREALSSTSSPHQKSRRSSCFALAPSRSQFGDSYLREHRLTLMHGRLGGNANPRHTPHRSRERGRFFFPIPRYTRNRAAIE